MTNKSKPSSKKFAESRTMEFGKLYGSAVTENSTKRKRSPLGCLIVALLALIATISGLWLVQQLVTPEVIDQPGVAIKKAKAVSDSEKTGAAAVANNPEGQSADVVPVGPVKITDGLSAAKVKAAKHPLDPLMELADGSMKLIDEKYLDYKTRIVSQVRTNVLNDETVMFVKLRHVRNSEDGKEIPFSIYTKFLSPRSKVGQEAIWVEGQNENNILGHATGLLNFKTVSLDPESSFAMRGNRYPIFQLGFRNLIVKMKEFGENDRKYGECEVEVERDVMVGDRKCVLLTVTHPHKREHFEYHIAKIYIDEELEIPIGYEGFLWPEEKGQEPPLLERYIYTELELNCGLKDADFDTSNPEYDYPRF